MAENDKIFGKIADDLTQEFMDKLRALGFTDIDIKYSNGAKKKPEREVPKSAFKEDVERKASHIIATAMESQRNACEANPGADISMEAIRRATSRMMTLIGEVISEVEFDRAYQDPTCHPGLGHVCVVHGSPIGKYQSVCFAQVGKPRGREGSKLTPLALALSLRGYLRETTLAFAEVHEQVAHKPDMAVVARHIDSILEHLYSRFDIYGKPHLKKSTRDLPVPPIDFSDVPRTSYFEFTDAEKKIWADPMPTGKFDKNLLRQHLASNYTIAEVNSFSENPPLMALNPMAARLATKYGHVDPIHTRLVAEYLEMFPAPPGMHNCLEVGCMAEVFDTENEGPVYKIKHALPLAVIIPPVSGVDKDKYIAESIPKLALCKANGCKLTDDGPQHYDEHDNKLEGTPDNHAWFSDDPNAPKIDPQNS